MGAGVCLIDLIGGVEEGPGGPERHPVPVGEIEEGGKLIVLEIGCSILEDKFQLFLGRKPSGQLIHCYIASFQCHFRAEKECLPCMHI